MPLTTELEIVSERQECSKVHSVGDFTLLLVHCQVAHAYFFEGLWLTEIETEIRKRDY